MVKPVFARRGRSEPLRTVAFGEEPLLFALVTRVAKAVGAPEPKRIVLDCRANAGAGYSSGVNAVLGRDLILTLGLPLVGGMTIQQLSGVIAHELGHFSQGTGMRLGFLVRSVNGWFARVVYERDDWDERLAAGAEKEDRMALLLLVAMLCIWITRRLLWVLMAIGHGLSCFMSRRMEYDADRYETRLAGSDSFAESTKKLIRLSIATDSAFAFADGTWTKSGRLPDDLAALAVAICDRLPTGEASQIEAAALRSKTGLFDTHPAHGDRIESARREKAPGIFHMAGPAALLFKDYSKTSRSLTLSFYRRVLGSKVNPNSLIPSATLLSGGGPRVNPLEG
jgi:Zn-dependent protease with chaperone function